MKFTFDRNAMINEISIAQEIISTKNALSVLSNVLLIAEGGTLTIKATDIKVNFQTKIPVDIEEEGSTTVLCDKFMGILSALPEGEIEFLLKDNDNLVSAVIRHTSKKIKYQLNCTSQDKFPEIAVAEKVSFFEVPAKELKSMITQTSFAVSDDETRYFMNGVYFEKKEDKLVLVATDGRRLAYAEKAVLAGNDDDARSFLQQKQRKAEQVESLKAAYDAAHENSNKMKAMHDHLTQEIQDMYARRDAIKAKLAVAKTQEKINEISSSVDKTKAGMSEFERMEAKVDNMLDTANAMAELNAAEGSVNDLMKKYDEAPSVEVEDELAALKARMGK